MSPPSGRPFPLFLLVCWGSFAVSDYSLLYGSIKSTCNSWGFSILGICLLVIFSGSLYYAGYTQTLYTIKMQIRLSVPFTHVYVFVASLVMNMLCKKPLWARRCNTICISVQGLFAKKKNKNCINFSPDPERSVFCCCQHESSLSVPTNSMLLSLFVHATVHICSFALHESWKKLCFLWFKNHYIECVSISQAPN